MIDFGMDEALVWCTRLALFVALGMGWSVVREAGRGWERWAYLAGWVGYVLYSLLRPTSLTLDRTIPVVCMTLAVLGLVRLAASRVTRLRAKQS